MAVPLYAPMALAGVVLLLQLGCESAELCRLRPGHAIPGPTGGAPRAGRAVPGLADLLADGAHPRQRVLALRGGHPAGTGCLRCSRSDARQCVSPLVCGGVHASAHGAVVAGLCACAARLKFVGRIRPLRRGVARGGSSSRPRSLASPHWPHTGAARGALALAQRARHASRPPRHASALRGMPRARVP
jgi:hypothetical protein